MTLNLVRFILLIFSVLFLPNVSNASTNLSKGQVVHILSEATTRNIAVSKLAETHGEAIAVKQYAERAVEDFTVSKETIKRVINAKDLIPKKSEISEEINSLESSAMKVLNSLRGEAFDNAYMTYEVKFHKNIIDIIDNKILPNLNNSYLEKIIQNMRTRFESFLVNGRQLKETMKIND